jgi:DNA invertase Pin-like site-specific DNA recombinase
MEVSEMAHLALYARVSTTRQDLDAQLHQLREYAARRDAEALVFEDRGVSGAKAARPGLDALMIAARRRQVDTVVCTRLDRLGRSVAHLASLAEELRSLGVALVVLDAAIDTTTMHGQLLFNLLGSVAEFERELLRERIREGQAVARRRGKHCGRPPALDRRACDRARRMHKAGKSYRAIGSVLGCSAPSVMRALRRHKAE